jgi:hypothetical protein
MKRKMSQTSIAIRAIRVEDVRMAGSEAGSEAGIAAETAADAAGDVADATDAVDMAVVMVDTEAMAAEGTKAA